VFYSNLAMR